MAFKESNPAMVHIVQHVILLSVLGILHLLLALTGLNGFIAVISENMDMMIPSMIVGYGVVSCMVPYVIPIYFIVVYSISLIRRGVYGEKHEKNTLRSFFFGIFGMIVPTVVGLVFLMFIEILENIYVIMPFFIHMIPIALIFAAYLFIKDIGGRNKGFVGFVLFSISSGLLATNEFIALAYDINHDLDDKIISLLFLAEMLLAITAMIAIIIMIRGFIDAKNWTKKHKPLMDTQQKQQLEMQQNQIKMQIEQLKLQQEQLELQKQSMEMLSDIKQESIGGGKEMLSERSVLSDLDEKDHDRDDPHHDNWKDDR